MKIAIDRKKYDFSDVGVEEYLKYFGYKNPRKVQKNVYEVDSIGCDLPSVKRVS